MSYQLSASKTQRGGVSECRNKSLQLMFQLMGGGDKAGSGMDKIRAGWRAQHWRSPRLEETVQPDRVKLVLPLVSLIPPEVEQALRDRFGELFARLDKTAVQAMVTAQVEGGVTNARMQEITGEHSKDLTAVLQALVRDGLLTQQNQRRWASYRVAGDSAQLNEDSANSAANSSQSSPQSPSDSAQLGGDSRQFDRLAGLSDEVLALLPMAEPAWKNKKLPIAQLQTIIQRLCAGRWLSTSELAALVDRDSHKKQNF